MALSKQSVQKFAIVAEQVVIYTLMVAGIGFYFGTQYQNHVNADRQAAIHAAVASAPKQ